MEYLTALSFFKLFQVILLSGVKFLFAPFIAVGYGFSYIQTVVLTTIGGILGLMFFYFISKWMIRQYEKLCPKIIAYFAGEEWANSYRQGSCKKQDRKKFTRTNKLIINIRKKYGYFGIILLTPILLSIPIGAFLAQKYYSKNNHVLVYLSLSVLFWSFCISSVYFLF